MNQNQFTCYVINLERSQDRWQRIEKSFKDIADVNLVRIVGIDGTQSPLLRQNLDCNYSKFRFCMGQEIRNGEIGCYLSHLKALETFLSSDQEWAVICEDDIIPDIKLSHILQEIIQFSDRWEFVRLARCRTKHFFPKYTLSTGQKLGINLTGFSFAAAYLINRRGAERILKRLKRIELPWDLALHSGLPGIRELSLVPGTFTIDVESEQKTTMEKRTFRTLGWFTIILYRIYARIRRYSIQMIRSITTRRFR